jgi:hypothetical protein
MAAIAAATAAADALLPATVAADVLLPAMGADVQRPAMAAADVRRPAAGILLRAATAAGAPDTDDNRPPEQACDFKWRDGRAARLFFVAAFPPFSHAFGQ